MNRPRLFALPILAGLLVLLLAAAWLVPRAAVPAYGQSPAVPATAANVLADAQVNQWAGIILARPLLSPSRRPDPVAGTAVSEPLPTLSAIVVIGSTRHAIFAEAGQKPQLVAEGGMIGAYRIKTIGPEKISMLGPNGPLTMKLQFIQAVPAASAPAGQ